MRIYCKAEHHEIGGPGSFFLARSEKLLPKLIEEYKGMENDASRYGTGYYDYAIKDRGVMGAECLLWFGSWPCLPWGSASWQPTGRRVVGCAQNGRNTNCLPTDSHPYKVFPARHHPPRNFHGGYRAV